MVTWLPSILVFMLQIVKTSKVACVIPHDTAKYYVDMQADPHPGNLIRTPDGRLAILDFGLVTEIDDNIKFGMVEAISHLIHRDYEAIVEDFVTLQFIDPGTNLRPILPVLAKVSFVFVPCALHCEPHHNSAVST